MSRRSRDERKRELARLVASGELDRVVGWAREVGGAAALLVPMLFDRDDARRWTATVALGKVASDLARSAGLEPVRVIVRRLLWNMTDESGGLAWHGPEAIAEILVRVPELVPEFGRITASYVDEEPFETGALYLVARLAPSYPEVFEDLVPRILDACGSPEPSSRALALEALAALRPEQARARASLLALDSSRITTYDGDRARVGETTVAELALRTAAALSGPGLVARRVGHRPSRRGEVRP